MPSWLEKFSGKSLEEIFDFLGEADEQAALERSLMPIPPDVQKILDDYRKWGRNYQIDESVLANPSARRRAIEIAKERTENSPLGVFFLRDPFFNAVREDPDFQELFSEPISQLMLDLRNNPDDEDPEELIERHGFDRPQEQQYYTFTQRPDEEEATEAEQMISRAFEVAKQSYTEGEDVRDIDEVLQMLDAAWADYLEGDIASRYEEFLNLPGTHYWHKEQDYPMSYEGTAQERAEQAWDNLVYEHPPKVFELPERLYEKWKYYEGPETWTDSEGNEHVEYYDSVGKLIGDYCVANPDETDAMTRELAWGADEGEVDLFFRTVLESDAAASVIPDVDPRLIKSASAAMQNRMLEWMTSSSERAEASEEALRNLAEGVALSAAKEVAEYERLHVTEGLQERVGAFQDFVEKMQDLRQRGFPIPWPEDELPEKLRQLRDRLEKIVPRTEWRRQQDEERRRRQEAEEADAAQEEEEVVPAEPEEEDGEAAEASSRAWLEKWASDSRRASALSAADVGPHSVTASFDVGGEATWDLDLPFGSRRVSVSVRDDLATASFDSPREAYHAVIWPEGFAEAAGLESESEVLEFLEALSGVRNAASKYSSGRFLGGTRTAARSLEDIFEELGERDEEVQLERQLRQPPSAERLTPPDEDETGEEDRQRVIGSDAVHIVESNAGPSGPYRQLRFDPPMLAAFLWQYGLRYLQARLDSIEENFIGIRVRGPVNTADRMEAMNEAAAGLNITQYARAGVAPVGANEGIITFTGQPPTVIQLRQDVAHGPHVGLVVEAMWPSADGSRLVVYAPLLQRVLDEAYNVSLVDISASGGQLRMTVEGDDLNDSFLALNNFNNLLLRSVPTVYEASMTAVEETPSGVRREVIVSSRVPFVLEGVLQEARPRAMTISRQSIIALALGHGLDAREVREEDEILSCSLFGQGDFDEQEFATRVEGFCRHLARVMHIEERDWGIGGHRMRQLPNAAGELHAFHNTNVFFEMPEHTELAASSRVPLEKLSVRSLEDIFDELGKRDEELELEQQLRQGPAREIPEEPADEAPSPPEVADAPAGHPPTLVSMADMAFYRDRNMDNRVVVNMERLRILCQTAGYSFSYTPPGPDERMLTLRLTAATNLALDSDELAEIIAEQPEVVRAQIVGRVENIVILSILLYSVPILVGDEEDDSGEEIDATNARDIWRIVDSANLIFAAPPFINNGRIVLYLASPMEESMNERDMRAEVVRERVSEVEGVTGATMNSTRGETAIYISFDREHVPEEVKGNPEPIQVDSDGIHFLPMELQRFLLWHGIQLDTSTVEVREEDGTTEITFFVDRTSHFVPEEQVENVLLVAMNRFRNWYLHIFEASITPDGSLLDVEITTNVRLATNWFRTGSPHAGPADAGAEVEEDGVFSVRNDTLVIDLSELRTMLSEHGVEVQGVPSVHEFEVLINVSPSYGDLGVDEDRREFDRQLASLQRELEGLPEVVQVNIDHNRNGARIQLVLSSHPAVHGAPAPPFHVSNDGTTEVDRGALSALMEWYGLTVQCGNSERRGDHFELTCTITDWPDRLNNYGARHGAAGAAAMRAAGDLLPSRVNWSIRGPEPMFIDFIIYPHGQFAGSFSGWLRAAASGGSLEDLFEELGRQEEEMEIERQLAEPVQAPEQAETPNSEPAQSLSPLNTSSVPIDEVMGIGIEGNHAANTMYVRWPALSRYLSYFGFSLDGRPAISDNDHRLTFTATSFSERRPLEDFQPGATEIARDMESSRFVTVRGQDLRRDEGGHVHLRIQLYARDRFFGVSSNEAPSATPFTYDHANDVVLIHPLILGPRFALRRMTISDFSIAADSIGNESEGDYRYFRFRVANMDPDRADAESFISDVHRIVAEIDMMTDHMLVAGSAVIPRSGTNAEVEFRLMREGRIVWPEPRNTASSARGWLRRAATGGSLEDLFEELGKREEEMELERQLSEPVVPAPTPTIFPRDFLSLETPSVEGEGTIHVDENQLRSYLVALGLDTATIRLLRGGRGLRILAVPSPGRADILRSQTLVPMLERDFLEADGIQGVSAEIGREDQGAATTGVYITLDGGENLFGPPNTGEPDLPPVDPGMFHILPDDRAMAERTPLLNYLNDAGFDLLSHATEATQASTANISLDVAMSEELLADGPSFYQRVQQLRNRFRECPVVRNALATILSPRTDGYRQANITLLFAMDQLSLPPELTRDVGGTILVDIDAFRERFVSAGMDIDRFRPSEDDRTFFFTVVDFRDRGFAEFGNALQAILSDIAGTQPGVESFLLDEAEQDPGYENSTGVRLQFFQPFDLATGDDFESALPARGLFSGETVDRNALEALVRQHGFRLTDVTRGEYDDALELHLTLEELEEGADAESRVMLLGEELQDAIEEDPAVLEVSPYPILGVDESLMLSVEFNEETPRTASHSGEGIFYQAPGIENPSVDIEELNRFLSEYGLFVMGDVSYTPHDQTFSFGVVSVERYNDRPEDALDSRETAEILRHASEPVEWLAEQVEGVSTAFRTESANRMGPPVFVYVEVTPEELSEAEWHPLRESHIAVAYHEGPEHTIGISSAAMDLAMNRTAADLVGVFLLPSDVPTLSMVFDKQEGRSDEEFRQHVVRLVRDLEQVPGINPGELFDYAVGDGRRIAATVEFPGEVRPVLNDPMQSPEYFGLNHLGRPRELYEDEDEPDQLSSA